MNNLEDNNYLYSIIIDNLEDNEKFVLSNNKNSPSGDNPQNDKNKSLILKIAIPIIVVVVIIIIVVIILCVRKNKGKEISKDVMKTSFEGNLINE